MGLRSVRTKTMTLFKNTYVGSLIDWVDVKRRVKYINKCEVDIKFEQMNFIDYRLFYLNIQSKS